MVKSQEPFSYPTASAAATTIIKAHDNTTIAIRHLIRLALTTLLVIALTWLSLYLFEQYLAPGIGIKHIHLQITESAVTVAMSFVLIYGVRQIIHKSLARISPHLSTVVSFFVIITVSSISAVVLMYQWGINPQVILVSGGVAAIIIGIALSTIVGNILAGGLVLTAFPAKVGDHVFMIGDNTHGVIDDVSLMFTKVITEDGMEYYIPNNAIVQGSVRIIRETSQRRPKLPISEGENVQIVTSSEKYTGTVSRITPKFFFLVTEDKKSEIMLPNANLLSGQYVIIKRKEAETQ
jgi:small conductance mechanosensitive channel